MKKILIFLVLGIVFVSACTVQTPNGKDGLLGDGDKRNEVNRSSGGNGKISDGVGKVECNTNRDCVRAGCSSQLCAPKNEASGIITTCEYREEYECLGLTNCGCINNKCAFEENEEYNKCLDEKQ